MLSNSQFGSHDSTEQDISVSSELEHPGELDISDSVKVAPTCIWRMLSLRNLYYNYMYMDSDDVPTTSSQICLFYVVN